MTEEDKRIIGSIKIVVSMLETADDGTGRFKKLIADMKLAEQRILRPTVNAPPEIATSDTDEPKQPKHGKITPVTVSKVGISTESKSGGKVSPVKV